jgi:hypothetical protein
MTGAASTRSGCPQRKNPIITPHSWEASLLNLSGFILNMGDLAFILLSSDMVKLGFMGCRVLFKTGLGLKYRDVKLEHGFGLRVWGKADIEDALSPLVGDSG